MFQRLNANLAVPGRGINSVYAPGPAPASLTATFPQPGINAFMLINGWNSYMFQWLKRTGHKRINVAFMPFMSFTKPAAEKGIKGIKPYRVYALCPGGSRHSRECR